MFVIDLFLESSHDSHSMYQRYKMQLSIKKRQMMRNRSREQIVLLFLYLFYVTVPIDVVNAFNFIPWDRIRRPLIKHRVPTYMRNIIGSYLSDRAIIYTIEGGIVL